MPYYILSESHKEVLQFYGHSIDENYSKLLIERKDLPLTKEFLLDRVQKKLPITDEAAAMLKKDQLIAGRKPNFYVEAIVAAATDDKAAYIKNRAFDDVHYKKMILEYLKKYKKADRKDIDKLLLDKLSDILDEKQKRNKVRNLLNALSKREHKIMNTSKSLRYPIWVLNSDSGKEK